MKVLIITSERLNPTDILSSTFELTQAIILQKSFDVAILSVSLDESLITNGKEWIKWGLSKLGILKRKMERPKISFFTLSYRCLSNRKIVNRYKISRIPVIEGTGFLFRNPTTFTEELNIWKAVGYAAFNEYQIKYGQPDLIHAHGRFLTAGALALEIKKSIGIKYLYTEHSTYFQRKLVPQDAVPICKEVIENACIYTVVSPSLLKHVEHVLNLSLPQARIIPNVLDTIFEKPLFKPDNTKPQFIFTLIAALEYKKGIDILIDAFQQCLLTKPNIRLNIYGAGSLMNVIQKTIVDNHLDDKIKLLGKKTKEEVIKILDEDTDAFVLPSRMETFGVVVIEALSRGVPVVATRSGGPEHIVTKACGLLVEPGNPALLAEAMLRMIDVFDQYDRNAIRSYALSKFGSEVFFQTMQKTYQEIVQC
jgi:teichuronic acid biosynthesis glycosyltransferase TuaC